MTQLCYDVMLSCDAIPADCCDGSDEPRGVCSDVCAEKGRAAREALASAAKEAGTGNKVGHWLLSSATMWYMWRLAIGRTGNFPR